MGRFVNANSKLARMLLLLLIPTLLSCTVGTAENGRSISGFDYRSWETAGGDKGVSHYSELDQINKSNVHQLQVAWIYKSGDVIYQAEPFWGGSTIQCNPIIVDGTMYTTTPTLRLVAVDATNGKEIWRFDPHKGAEGGGYNRGVAYWRDKDQKRLFFGVGPHLYAVDASTGKPVDAFGQSGQVPMGAESRLGGGAVSAPAAPVIYKDLVIVGEMSSTVPGTVTAYSARTGQRRWVFHTIPHPGEVGYETYGDPNFYRTGAAANVWGGLSVDEQFELVFFATGQPEHDFYRPFNNGAHLFANSVVAVNANTGKRVWHFQELHHELWDLDLPCPPALVTLELNGQKVPALVQLSKTGNTYVFNRLTGELFSRIEERPAPPSKLVGEQAFPTQPHVISPEPFSKQFVVTEQDLTNISPEAHAQALERFKKADTGWYVPPSERGILYYGIHGGAEWGGGALDPENGYLYINSNDIAWFVRMSSSEQVPEARHPGFSVYQKNRCVPCHGAKGEGIGGKAPLINLKEKYDRDRLMKLVQKGIGTMPGFSAISGNDLQALADFLLDVPSDAKTSEKDRARNFYAMTAFEKFLDTEGYPATKPPWGTLNAVNLKSGRIAWKIPLGEHEVLTKRGLPQTGTENFGGPIVTKGGLVFIAATQDEKFRAFDKDTGKLLWEAKLPFGGYTTPSTYEVKGKQYVVIPCGGGGKPSTKPGDAFVAFALPR
jgi:quinoprotein glucose dehydrogenase